MPSSQRTAIVLTVAVALVILLEDARLHTGARSRGARRMTAADAQTAAAANRADAVDVSRRQSEELIALGIGRLPDFRGAVWIARTLEQGWGDS